MGENDPQMFGSSPFHARNNPWELPDISANPGAPNGKTPFVPLCFTLCSRFYSFLENQIIYLLEEGEAKKKKKIRLKMSFSLWCFHFKTQFDFVCVDMK